MPLLTVEGIYRDGKVELAERPQDIDEAAQSLSRFCRRPALPRNRRES